MIVGSGVDIIEVDRMKKAMETWGDRLLKRIFTDKEIEYANKRKNAPQHLAARFCAKEALLKAIGGGRQKGLKWTEAEILNDRDGKPKVMLFGSAKKLVAEAGIEEVTVSMSHTKDYAVASAILVKDEK